MDIVITGGTGFLGSALSRRLRARGDRVRLVSRHAGGANTIGWDPSSGRLDPKDLVGADAVVHLAGQGIAARPWNKHQRQLLLNSRVQGTRTLVRALAAMEEPPTTLVSASAIGFYGDRGDEVLDEGSSPGHDFLADLCVAWEAEAAAAADALVETVGANRAIRVATVRTGIVLDSHGGALGKQLLAYRAGLGARAGRGTQWMSWISLRDHIAAMIHLLDNDLAGPFNLTAPNPVTNREFTKAVAAQLHRPTFLVIPRLATKAPLGVGPLIESLLFASQRVLPRALEASGFAFTDRIIDPALAHVLRGHGSD